MNKNKISLPKFPMSIGKDMSLPKLPISFGKEKDVDSIRISAEVFIQKASVFEINDYSATVADTLFELIGQKVFLQLVSRDQIDPGTGTGQKSREESLSWNPLDGPLAGETKCKITFKWKPEWGVPGALLVKNTHLREFFLKSVTLSNVPGKDTIRFQCNSWIYSFRLPKSPVRVFFSTESYLPRDTPAGLTELRTQELAGLRGDGRGERQVWHCIYDYDVYNDLGNPDVNSDLKRPVLGGSEDLPYPRRCRTGRSPAKKDRTSESMPRLPTFFVPPDEKFPHLSLSHYRANLVRAFAKKAIPSLKNLFAQKFNSLQDVKSIYSKGISGPINSIMELTRYLAPVKMVKELLNTQDEALISLTVPQVLKEDENAWRTDEEFARQALSGLNPMAIQCLKGFPPTSSLEVDLYGPPESSITAKRLENENLLDGLSAQEAVEKNRLFILDYYDAYMPYIERINKQDDGLKMYASRTFLFLTNEGTLRVVAIELCLPPTTVSLPVRNVYTPAEDEEEGALWLLAKAHARSNDSAYHQLVSHWLRTHAVIEPFIIATHRQLSKMHPLHKLLLPHFLGTMDINQSARCSLINAQGVIESGFTAGRYCMELSSKAYKHWRFNEQGLPADLLKRGMAVADPATPHGLKLVVEDYPYAVDGLEIWSALKQWVHDYLSLYYNSDESIKDDGELQTWWKEVVNVGHGDLKSGGGWYQMESMEEMVEAITTLIWVASAHHAAVNFGQYAYGGYMPNLPTISRRLIPEKGSCKYIELVNDPEAFLLKSVSAPSQATTVMAVLELLSKHSADEVYLGQLKGSTPEWNDDEGIVKAFSRFSEALLMVEENVTARNELPELKNRKGPAQVPYTLLYPCTSDESKTGGLTGKGIPNSISI